ncbi:MAG: alanine--glyoxylate aminotransferase family protein [Bdellovibrionaceae bacterium]|nr:alanine--glyoxylate aminotransferase family protein [Pseudobdellovibrionaceae bacterium]
MKTYRLMTPGPVPLPDWVLNELAQPVIHHRTTEFEAILERTLTHLKTVFQTKNHCFILTATGTGAMEASLTNTLSRGAKVISIISGKFGQRWHEMAQTLGYRSVPFEVPWGEDIDLEYFKKMLFAHADAEAVLCQACETSTGALLPVKELAAMLKKSKTLLICDAITGLGAISLPMDEWGLDVVIGGSQKALMLPTGLALMSLSEKAWEKTKTIAPTQTYYWNLVEEYNSNKKMQTRFSSATTLIRAMDLVLQHIQKIGFHNWLNAHQERATHFRRLVLNPEITMFPATPSPSLSCLHIHSADTHKLQTVLQDKYSIVVMGGQDHLKGKVLRVGHMGWMTNEDLTQTAQAIHSALKEIK